MRLLDLNSTKIVAHPSECEEDGVTPKEGASLFHIRPLSSSEQGVLRDSLVKMSPMMAGAEKPNVNMDISVSAHTSRRVRLGLTNWENVQNADGTPMAYETEEWTLGAKTHKGLTSALMDCIPIDWIDWLNKQIEGISSMTVGEGKR